MQFQSLFKAAVDRPVKVALIGAGEFGLSLIAQSRAMRGLEVVAVVDTRLDAVETKLASNRVPARRVSSAAEATAAMAAGEMALSTSAAAVMVPPVEMIIEATGEPEWAARHALAAMGAGIGVTMVSKETECVVGPVLAARARKAGVPYALVDGDQPALLVQLVSWARMLGLEVIAAGKSSEYDYVWDAAASRVTWTDRATDAPGLDRLWSLGADVPGTLAKRTELLSALPQRTVPDYCEMVLVANATGMPADRGDFHAPLTRAFELAEVYKPAAEGGVLKRTGTLDVFNCLRRSDEASFAGGVFVVVAWPDADTGRLLMGKGIPSSRDNRYGLIYNPSHLLGVEAPMSILAATRAGNPNVDESYRPVADMVARADADLPAGRKLDIVGNRHVVPGLTAEMAPAQAVKAGAPCPYYMAVGRTLVRDVKKGAIVMVDDVSAAHAESALAQLRAEQDAMFGMA